jgi:Protein of unknown function (DUF2934)
MPEPTEQEIAERAFEIWERQGKPGGRENEFWRQAEAELRAGDRSHPLQMPEPLM